MPSPILLVTETLPPIFSMIYLQILRPRPVPLVFDFACSFKLLKFINSLEMPSSLIPEPLSLMVILKLTCLRLSKFSISYSTDGVLNTLQIELLDYKELLLIPLAISFGLPTND